MSHFLCVIAVLASFFQHTVSQKVQCYSVFSLSTGKCESLLGEVGKDDCCLNSAYGYKDATGECVSCREAAWTEWSSWSKCSVTCAEGVWQRRRGCYGNGTCEDPQNLGDVQTEPCEQQACCPVEGGWAEWGGWQPCSVTCATGIKRRQRTCSDPSPGCGGSCTGLETESAPCDTETICPTHGGWSSWGNWAPCPVTCSREEEEAKREVRERKCNNPSPSTVPRGRDCEGPATETRPCRVDFCPINGNWGPWSALAVCSVTCGVGLTTQRRTCDSPKPKYGGTPCQGDDQNQTVCVVRVECPVDGRWKEWSAWGHCKPPSSKDIRCRPRDGDRRKERECTGRKNDGRFCDGEIVQYGKCYNISGCEMKSAQSEWSKWTYCTPNCGPNSVQTRERKCIPDLSKYRNKDFQLFVGRASIDCSDVADEIEERPCRNVPEC